MTCENPVRDFFLHSADRNTSLRWLKADMRGEAARKTSGTEWFHSLFSLTFDQFYRITFKPMTVSISHCDHKDWHMKTWHIHVTWQIWSGFNSCGTNYIIPPWKLFLISKHWLSCRLFDANVMCNGGYYNLVLKIFEIISTLFTCTVMDDNLSVRPHTNRSKFNTTDKEVANLNWEH